MAEKEHQVLRYRILRYMPNLMRDEWVNIGVLLEQPVEGPSAVKESPARRVMRVIEEETEILRLRRIHPGADENLLRALAVELQNGLNGTGREASTCFQKLDSLLSNALQFGPQVALFASDFDSALDRLYRDHVEHPPMGRAGILENTRGWIRARLNDVFARYRLLSRLERGVRVEEFTQPGDPMRLDYAYRSNATRGYLQAIVLGRDPAPAKLFAYTAARIRARVASSEFTAITEEDFSPANRRHSFVARLFEEQGVNAVPLSRIENFAASLKPRLS